MDDKPSCQLSKGKKKKNRDCPKGEGDNPSGRDDGGPGDSRGLKRNWGGGTYAIKVR